VNSVVLARLLGEAGFGELGVIQGTVGVFGVFAGFGMGLTATKHVAEFRTSDPAKAGRIMGLSSAVAWLAGSILSGTLVFLAPWLAATTLNAPHLGHLLRIAAFLLVLGAVNGAQTGALCGLEAFGTIARVNLIVGILSLPLVISGAHLWKLEGAVVGLVVTQAASCVLMHFGLRRVMTRVGVSPSRTGCLKEWPVLAKFAVPAVLSGATVGPVNWICAALLVNQPNGYAEMGVFNAANQWRMAFLFLPAGLTEAAVPVMSERAVLGDAGPRRILRHLLILNAALGVPTLIGLCVCSRSIMGAYGPAFRNSSRVFAILQVAAFIQLMQSPFVKFWTATNRMWENFATNILWAATVVVSSYLLVRRGAAGLALGQLLGFSVYGLLLLTFIWRRQPVA
jgi:O-antigen/teichoic acid export membrane protein